MVASSAAASAMKVDAWNSGAMLMEAPFTRAVMKATIWPLVWNIGKPVNIRSPGTHHSRMP
jgi:hypothetical protein